MFGRHCAVLGATGGGKSWTVARIRPGSRPHRRQDHPDRSDGGISYLHGRCPGDPFGRRARKQGRSPSVRRLSILAAHRVRSFRHLPAQSRGAGPQAARGLAQPQAQLRSERRKRALYHQEGRCRPS
ncbi:helicase HerA domain-containing protein [Paraburkholderia phenazinium]|uniref:helicase HerA domain-containing protein n=1 Tax=Paraburkholderia phenazinium TaxID=60549 RepID=UPI000940DB7B|nr:DUF87 domain-containing protein [Paraburkholderia phenazinium]